MSVSMITAFNKLRETKEYFLDAERECKGGKGSTLAKRYLSKLDWMFKDFITTPGLPPIIINEVKKQWESDLFVIDELYKKINLLPSEKRELFINIVDAINNGQQLEIEQK
jgi:hypothetical protein